MFPFNQNTSFGQGFQGQNTKNLKGSIIDFNGKCLGHIEPSGLITDIFGRSVGIRNFAGMGTNNLFNNSGNTIGSIQGGLINNSMGNPVSRIVNPQFPMHP